MVMNFDEIFCFLIHPVLNFERGNFPCYLVWECVCMRMCVHAGISSSFRVWLWDSRFICRWGNLLDSPLEIHADMSSVSTLTSCQSKKLRFTGWANFSKMERHFRALFISFDSQIHLALVSMYFFLTQQNIKKCFLLFSPLS